MQTEPSKSKEVDPTVDGTTVAVQERRSRIGSTWIALAVFVLVLLFLLIFILQNSKSVTIHYLGYHAHIAFGVAVLLAAVVGSILTLLIGSIRIVQLKMRKPKG